MKYILFEIGNLKVYGYGFFIALGMIAGVIMAKILMNKKGIDFDKAFSMFVVCLIAGFIGAKLLFIITVLPDIIADPSAWWEILKTSGLVVYGGVIAAAMTAVIYSKHHNMNVLEYIDGIAPALALAQGFGRIGCLMAGCCYGALTDSPIGINFVNSPICPPGNRYPTQIFSSIFDFALSITLTIIFLKKKKDGIVAFYYFMLYSIGRFIIECFRSDPRGAIGPFSTSQLISIIIFVICVTMLIIERVKNKKTNKGGEDN